jgi:hypothetical protein
MTPEELSRRVLARLPARRLSRSARYGGWGALVLLGALLAGFAGAAPIVPLGLGALVTTVLVIALTE